MVDCGSLNDPNHGSVSLSTTVYNSVATYSCDIGYSLDGDDERRCLKNKQWSGTPPTCSGGFIVTLYSVVDNNNILQWLTVVS